MIDTDIPVFSNTLDEKVLLMSSILYIFPLLYTPVYYPQHQL
jgi:hypothetical protein